MTSALETVSRLTQALAEAKTPEVANLIRRQVSAIQKLLGHRTESFEMAWKAARGFCEASAAAGHLYGDLQPRLRAEDAGFNSRMDATRCVRLAELDPQDRELYYDDCLTRNWTPSVHGLERVWRLLHDEEPEEGSPCPYCGRPMPKRNV